MPMNMPHLTAYFDPNLRYVVDEDLPDNTDGTRNPGGAGLRFANAESAGEHVACWLRRMAIKPGVGFLSDDAAAAEEGRRIHAANEDFYTGGNQ